MYYKEKYLNPFKLIKVFMKRDFLPQFLKCIRKCISKNHNTTSSIEFLNCLTKIFNFISYENYTTSDVIVDDYILKNFIDLKINQ